MDSIGGGMLWGSKGARKLVDKEFRQRDAQKKQRDSPKKALGVFSAYFPAPEMDKVHAAREVRKARRALGPQNVFDHLPDDIMLDIIQETIVHHDMNSTFQMLFHYMLVSRRWNSVARTIHLWRICVKQRFPDRDAYWDHLFNRWDQKAREEHQKRKNARRERTLIGSDGSASGSASGSGGSSSSSSSSSSSASGGVSGSRGGRVGKEKPPADNKKDKKLSNKKQQQQQQQQQQQKEKERRDKKDTTKTKDASPSPSNNGNHRKKRGSDIEPANNSSNKNNTTYSADNTANGYGILNALLSPRNNSPPSTSVTSTLSPPMVRPRRTSAHPPDVSSTAVDSAIQSAASSHTPPTRAKPRPARSLADSSSRRVRRTVLPRVSTHEWHKFSYEMNQAVDDVQKEILFRPKLIEFVSTFLMGKAYELDLKTVPVQQRFFYFVLRFKPHGILERELHSHIDLERLQTERDISSIPHSAKPITYIHGGTWFIEIESHNQTRDFSNKKAKIEEPDVWIVTELPKFTDPSEVAMTKYEVTHRGKQLETLARQGTGILRLLKYGKELQSMGSKWKMSTNYVRQERETRSLAGRLRNDSTPILPSTSTLTSASASASASTSTSSPSLSFVPSKQARGLCSPGGSASTSPASSNYLMDSNQSVDLDSDTDTTDTVSTDPSYH
eukprot:TRINITY_DN131_c2_g1_i1.p2 TRINITY_DN131_c2_g1~~TRINITY_DN131_c2_g1_i1.p2  ORF type:complete len:682 (+),score=188.88 TRINITY_DN131_c2_g1_i1:34-2046(+)